MTKKRTGQVLFFLISIGFFVTAYVIWLTAAKIEYTPDTQNASSLRSGTITNSLIDTSSITKQGNVFNGASQLLQADSGGLLPNADLATSSVTKQGNTFNGADQLLLLNNSAGFVVTGTGNSPVFAASSQLVSSGTTIVGDASGDIVTVNAASFTFVNTSTINVNAAGLSIDDATLYIDGPNSRVGITTPYPSHRLTVEASVDGDASLARFNNTNSGTSAESTVYIGNTRTTADSLALQAIGTGFTTSGGFVQDAGAITAGTGLSGGLSIIVRAAADMRFYTGGFAAGNERMRLNSGDAFLRLTQTTDCDTVTPGAVGEICVQNSATCPISIATATVARAFACLTVTVP